MHDFLRCTMSFRIIHFLWILHENISLPWKEQLTKRARWLKNIHPIYICTVTTNWPFRNLGRKKIPKISLYCLWKKGLVKQGVRTPLISHFIFSSAKQSITQTIQGWCVFRLLSEMVREDQRILLNSQIQAVHLRVLFRTDGQPSCRCHQHWNPLLVSFTTCLKGIWKSRRGFSGASLWSWSANTRNNFAQWFTVPGWHRALGRTEVLLALPWTECKTCLELHSRYPHRRAA